MDKCRSVRVITGGADEVGGLSFVVGPGQHGVGDIEHTPDHFGVEDPPGNGGREQDIPRLGRQPLETNSDDHSHRLGNVQLIYLEPRLESPLVIEKRPRFAEMKEYLLDEEGIAFGLALDHPDQPRWGLLTGQTGDHRRHVRFGQATQRDSRNQAATGQFVDRAGKRV